MSRCPFSAERIVSLADNPPSVDDRVRLFLSVTTDLPTVQFVGEIVGWQNKQKITQKQIHVLQRLIWTLQPSEGGLYYLHSDEKKQSVNLLHVWRIQRLSNPFPVDQLIKTSTNTPLSPNRSTAGGWSYVHNPSDDWLAKSL